MLVAMTSATTTWLRQFHRPAAARDVLVMFPPAGGAASQYRELSAALDPQVQVHAVQYPGRQDRIGDPMVPSITGLAQQIAGAVPTPNGRPLSLFGHSMGATVMFETARLLQARGVPLKRVFVSGRVPPPVPRTTRFHAAGDEELIRELERLANDPSSLAVLREHKEIAEMVLPAVRSDYQAVETYRYQPSDGPDLRVPVSVFVSRDDPSVTVEQAHQWQAHTSGGFDVSVFPGRHFYLDVHTQEVAAAIRAALGAGV